MKAFSLSVAFAIVAMTTAFSLTPESGNASTKANLARPVHASVACAHCNKKILETIYYCSKCKGPIGGTCRGSCPN